MKLNISGDHLHLHEGLHEFIERRLLFALERFNGAIFDADVRVSDENGPHGRTDWRCMIRVHARNISPVIIVEHASNLRAAVARAADRAGRNLARSLDRKRQKRDHHAPKPLPAEIPTPVDPIQNS